MPGPRPLECDQIARAGCLWQMVRDDGTTFWRTHWKRMDAQVRIFLPRGQTDDQWQVLFPDWNIQVFSSDGAAFGAAAAWGKG